MAAYDILDAKEEGEKLVEVQLQLQDIARSEITRYRGRLASLTTEQQSAVEALLISMADKISHQVIDRIQSYPDGLQMKYVSVWNSPVAA